MFQNSSLFNNAEIKNTLFCMFFFPNRSPVPHWPGWYHYFYVQRNEFSDSGDFHVSETRFTASRVARRGLQRAEVSLHVWTLHCP